MQIKYEDFEKVEIRAGRIIEVEDFPEARKAAYKLTIDLGSDIGIKKSSAQITEQYRDKQQLIGKQVLCVVNFAPKKIGPFLSEVLTLGVNDANGHVVLVAPETTIPNGARLY